MPHNVCIHVGLPKTGTTFLQEAVFPNVSDLNDLGKQPARRGTDGADFLTEGPARFRDALPCETIHDRQDEQRQLFERYVKPKLDDSRLNLLSEESFADGTMDRGLIAERICDMFGPVKFVITIRRRQDLARMDRKDQRTLRDRQRTPSACVGPATRTIRIHFLSRQNSRKLRDEAAPICRRTGAGRGHDNARTGAERRCWIA